MKNRCCYTNKITLFTKCMIKEIQKRINAFCFLVLIGVFPLSLQAIEVETALCNVSPSQAGYQFTHSAGTSNLFSFLVDTNQFQPETGSDVVNGHGCFHSVAPTLEATQNCDINSEEQLGVNYFSMYNKQTDTSCLFRFETSTGTGNNAFLLANSPVLATFANSPPAQNQTENVPIFSPLGLLFLISGYIWFSRRYKH